LPRSVRGLVFVAALFGLWAYFGFPSPVTLAEWPSAKQDCVDFAEKHKSELFFDSASKPIKAVDSWLKNGKVVVEIGAFDDTDATYMPRLCVVGGDRIQIVSILENAAWR
jgi:hypothetical protein